MTSNKSIFILLFPLLVIASECPDDFIAIDNSCFYKKHIDVLQDFIDVNESLRGLAPQDMGTQKWKGGKLIYLYLGSHLLTTIPDSIGLLSNLSYLDLRENKITVIPDGICKLYPHHKRINLSDNNICPPYPDCIDYISQQNTKSCESFWCPDEYIQIEDECYKEEHITVLESIIENNESLNGLTPLDLGQEIGYQYWENGNLKILHLMSNELTALPEDVCNIYPELESFDVSNNSICPPYPTCIEYLGYQDIQNCITQPDQIKLNQSIINNREILSRITDISTSNIENFYNDLSVLQDIIDNNNNLKGKHPLEIGRQQWENMRLVSLDLSDLDLMSLPPSICNIYYNLFTFDISNNLISGSLPPCIEDRDNKSVACKDGDILFDEKCYYFGDIKVLIDFIKLNPEIEHYHPLMLGNQIWKNNRLQLLYLDGLEISTIPESIQSLDSLDFLTLNNNKLSALPDAICTIYPNLIGIDLTNNHLCPPYLDCFDYIGRQNTENCPPQDLFPKGNKNDLCPSGYIEYDGKCYFQKDLEVLEDFIYLNISLEGRKPLEIGVQKWKNMRLDFLYLGVNNLTVIPESICEIYPNLSAINISRNKICPPYPACITAIVKEQDTSSCP